MASSYEQFLAQLQQSVPGSNPAQAFDSLATLDAGSQMERARPDFARADAYRGLADRFSSYGDPYRRRLAELYSNPNSFLSSPEVTTAVQQGSDILSRSLSRGGNPVGSGNALQQIQSYATDQLFSRLGQEKDRLAGFGGIPQFNAAAPQMERYAIDAEADAANNAFTRRLSEAHKYPLMNMAQKPGMVPDFTAMPQDQQYRTQNSYFVGGSQAPNQRNQNSYFIGGR